MKQLELSNAPNVYKTTIQMQMENAKESFSKKESQIVSSMNQRTLADCVPKTQFLVLIRNLVWLLSCTHLWYLIIVITLSNTLNSFVLLAKEDTIWKMENVWVAKNWNPDVLCVIFSIRTDAFFVNLAITWMNCKHVWKLEDL